MITELFWTDGHSYAPGHEPSVLDWVRYFINQNSELLISIGSGLVSFYITLIVLRRIVAIVRRALRDPYAEDEVAQEALRKLAEAEAQRAPRAHRRAAPGAVAPESHGAAGGRDGGWDGLGAAPAGGYPGQYGGGHPAPRSERYDAGASGAHGHGGLRHGGQRHGAETAAPAAKTGHAPRPGSFFAHRRARASR